MAAPLASDKSIELRESRSPSPQAVPGGGISNNLQTMFAASLKSKDRTACAKLLDEHSDSLTRPGSAFEWLKDTAAIGLTSIEIVSLLLEGSEQTPWICYDLVSPVDHGTDPIYYRRNYIKPILPNRSGAEIKRTISELCGLGGIIPTPDNRALWGKNAHVWPSPDRCATVFYGSVSEAGENPRWVRGILDQCLDALDRLIKLFRWLRLSDSVCEHLVIFNINRQHQVEAVRVPFTLVTKLRHYVVQTNVSSADGSLEENVKALNALTEDILRLISDPRGADGTLVSAVENCAIVVQALCLAMLSFGQAHIGEIDPFFLEHSLSRVIIRGTPGNTSSSIYFQLATLTCAGDMIDSKVMAFARQQVKSDDIFDLCITPDDLLDLWGPGTVVLSQAPRPEAILSFEWLSGIAIRGGIIYKPSKDSSKMHWKAGTADNANGVVSFELSEKDQIIIGAFSSINELCPTEPGENNTVSRTNNTIELRELGTRRARWSVRERQGGFQGGQFLIGGLNATWIRSDSVTRKQRGLEQVDLDFLNKPWGLLVSVCTGIAQRVALREVVAEVMLPMMEARMRGLGVWHTLMSTNEGVLRALRQPNFRGWCDNLELDARLALEQVVVSVLQRIGHTGVNDDDALVVACPQRDDSGSCIHFSPRTFRALTWILKDTERSATFACLTNTCFVVNKQVGRCQATKLPGWQNHISALITSMCQYRWLGADDWAKVPTNLQNGGVYWMGTDKDKRRVTIGATNGPTMLRISNSPSHWGFFRRAWERFEKIRDVSHVELRERISMAEADTKDVVIVRE